MSDDYKNVISSVKFLHTATRVDCQVNVMRNRLARLVEWLVRLLPWVLLPWVDGFKDVSGANARILG